MNANLPAVVALNDLERMAQAFAKSGMFGAKTPEQAMALLLLAQGEGLHPAIAMRDFDIIQGRPAKKAEAMLRSFIAAGGRVEWHCMTDEKADATFSHEQGGTVRIDWDMARAKRAGVGNKDNYNKYPRQMLANRVISEGCRRVYPASTSGLYVPEEVIQFRGEKDITPSSGAMAALPLKDQETINETAAQVKAMVANDQLADAYALWQNSNFDTDQQVAFWSTLNSKEKGVLGRLKEAENAQDKGTISPAKHKRLEALIKEYKLDREGLKNWCSLKFNKGHFTALSNDEYMELDDHIAMLMVPQTASAAATSSPRTPPPASAPLADATITEAQEGAIRDLLTAQGVELKALLLKAESKKLAELQANQYERAVKWIKAPR